MRVTRRRALSCVLAVFALLTCVYAAFAWGPFGLRAEYETRTSRRLAQLGESRPLTDTELGPLPLPVQRYLRYVGVVGQPRVRAQGSIRLASRGEGRYAATSGEYAYVQFDSLDVSYDVTANRK